MDKIVGDSVNLVRVPERQTVQSVAPAKDVVFTSVPGGIALLNTKTNIYFSLNAVGAEVWAGICEGFSETQISAALALRYDAPEHVIENDVSALMQDLKRAGLLVSDGEHKQEAS